MQPKIKRVKKLLAARRTKKPTNSQMQTVYEADGVPNRPKIERTRGDSPALLPRLSPQTASSANTTTDDPQQSRKRKVASQARSPRSVTKSIAHQLSESTSPEVDEQVDGRTQLTRDNGSLSSCFAVTFSHSLAESPIEFKKQTVEEQSREVAHRKKKKKNSQPVQEELQDSGDEDQAAGLIDSLR